MVRDNTGWGETIGAAWAEENHAHLLGLARGLATSPADADDLVQDVWLEVLEHPPERFVHFRGWAAVVARRTAVRSRRRERARREREQRAARVPVDRSTLDRCARNDLRESLGTIVDRLRSPYREVVAMRYLQELSIGEICDRLERPAGTVRCQLKRGLEHVRSRVGESEERSVELLA